MMTSLKTALKASTIRLQRTNPDTLGVDAYNGSLGKCNGELMGSSDSFENKKGLNIESLKKLLLVERMDLAVNIA